MDDELDWARGGLDVMDDLLVRGGTHMHMRTCMCIYICI